MLSLLCTIHAKANTYWEPLQIFQCEESPAPCVFWPSWSRSVDFALPSSERSGTLLEEIFFFLSMSLNVSLGAQMDVRKCNGWIMRAAFIKVSRPAELIWWPFQIVWAYWRPYPPNTRNPHISALLWARGHGIWWGSATLHLEVWQEPLYHSHKLVTSNSRGE